jgi:hypothetical protein
MGSEIDKNNIIKATMEELTEDERRAYLVAEEHLREQFLQGFKKERGGLFKRVEEFVMPSFKLNDNKVTQAQLVRPAPMTGQTGPLRIGYQSRPVRPV